MLMDKQKEILPFQSETYNNIKKEFANLKILFNTYLVLANPFIEKIGYVESLLETAEDDYNEEVKKWLENPKTECEHKNLQSRIFTTENGEQVYEVVCKDCGTILNKMKGF